MAAMKVEFLHHYHRRHRRSLHDTLVAHLPRYARTAARLAPLLNLRDRVPGLAALSEAVAGFAAHRSLPKWRRDYFRGAREIPAAADGGVHKEVVLFADTFNTYFEPENLRAAVKVLAAAGYTIHVPTLAAERPLCCGRTYLATGMVAAARQEARRVLDSLGPFVARGVPVVGLEPSCLLGLRDEFLTLHPGAESAALAKAAQTFEEFIVNERRAGRWTLSFGPAPFKRVLVHGHCHQKAFGTMPAVISALNLLPDVTVGSIQSSCCGMAGAFGYRAEYLAVSRRMAEANLLPAVRAAASDTVIVADGMSCRHQIHDGAGRDALHVARILALTL